MSTPKKFIAGQSVRVAKPVRLTRKISGSQGVIRQPLPTDVAEVVDVITSVTDTPQVITAEYVEDGKVVWRAEFTPEELELVQG